MHHTVAHDINRTVVNERLSCVFSQNEFVNNPVYYRHVINLHVSVKVYSCVILEALN